MLDEAGVNTREMIRAPILGELPLSAVDNDAVRGLVKKRHDRKLASKTIVEIVTTAKLVVASLKVNGEEVYKHTWDHAYICQLGLVIPGLLRGVEWP